MSDDKKDPTDLQPTSRAVRFSVGAEEMAVLAVPELDGARFPELTRDENEVCSHLLGGLTNAEIAAARGVSPNTIENQAASIFRKLAVFSRSELVVLAVARSSEESAIDSSSSSRRCVAQRPGFSRPRLES